jgi:hypothetical protein
MAGILGQTIGRILTALGYDGVHFRPLTLDTSGHLQVDVLTGGGGDGHMYVFDGVNWLPVVADGAGQLMVVVASGIPNPIGVTGRTAGAAQVQPLVYADGRQRYRWMDGITELASSWTFTATAGQKYVDSDPVPADTTWVVTHATFVNQSGTGAAWRLAYLIGANIYYLYYAASVTTNVPLWLTANLYMPPTSWLRFTAETAAVGAVLRLSLFGYAMPKV